MNPTGKAAEKVRFLRALAFEIHRKRPAAEALAECIEREGRGGKHRLWRPASAALEADGFVPALLAADLVGEEAGIVLAVLAAGGDHRLLSAALGALADHHEAAG